MLATERFDAAAFLAELTAPRADLQLPVTVPDTSASVKAFGPDDLPADWRVEFEERAAVREYDGGQAREHAEAEAFTEILARMRAAGDCT